MIEIKGSLLIVDNITDIDMLKEYHKRNYGHSYSENTYRFNGILNRSRKASFFYSPRIKNILPYLVRDINQNIGSEKNNHMQKKLIKAYWSF